MQEEKISVIVPVYNVEQYLERCMTSIVGQTYQNLEILLIDDGSTDRSGELCDEWGKKDEKIRVIHKKHSGLSEARNAGLKAVTGTYVAFVDGNDWIHTQMIEMLYRICKDEKADIAECDFVQADDEKTDDRKVELSKLQSFQGEQAMEALLNEEPLRVMAWNKLYRFEMMRNITFPGGKYDADDFWTYQVIGKSHKVVCCKEALYYRLGDLPEDRKDEQYSLFIRDSVEGKYERYQYVKKNFPKLELTAKKNLFFLIISYGQKVLLFEEENLKEQVINELEKYIQKLIFQKKEFRKCKMKERIWINQAQVSLENCCAMRNSIKKE